MALVLKIRYANPDTTPSKYRQGGHTRTSIVTQDDYWEIHGEQWALEAHVQKALDDNNLNDYSLTYR